jgi:hypothetical protein
MGFYAIQYPYGMATGANSGNRYGNYYRFRSREERDRWVGDGPNWRGAPNFRETIPSRDPELRRMLRADRKEVEQGYHAWRVEDFDPHAFEL